MSLCFSSEDGGELGPAVVKRILEYHFGCSANDIDLIDIAKHEWKRNNRTCFFSVGRIFHHARNGDHIWGTGIDHTRQDQHPEWLHVHSVRGSETERIVKEWYKYKRVPFGDPAFMIPFLYQDYYHLPTRSIGVEPTFAQPRFCFVARAQDLQVEFLKKMPSHLHIISAKQHWITMIEEIRMCDFVASTSLYGLELADALCIPTKWYQFPETQDARENFVYYDYLWSIGRTVKEPNSTFTLVDLKKTKTYQEPLALGTREEFVTRSLSSFPFHIFRKTLLTHEKVEIDADCKVKFKNNNMVLCVASKDSGFTSDVGLHVVKRLLENRFRCSADDLPIVALNERNEKHACLFVQGSVVDNARAGDHLWGVGTRSRRKGRLPYHLVVHSVRGHMTESSMRKSVIKGHSLPLGEPGFLLPYLYREYMATDGGIETGGPRSRFCFILGIDEDEQKMAAKLPEGVDIVSSNLSPLRAMALLLKCDRVASSSLNGIIFADSLGLPTLRFLGGVNKPDDLEYVDYFGSTGRKTGRAVNNFNEITNMRGYVEPLSIDEREVYADKTAESFPFDLFEVGQNRTLVIVMGSIRGGELAWQSLYRNVLDLNSADLALVVGAVDPGNRTSSLYERAKYLYEFPEFDDWADAIDLVNGTSWRDELFPYMSKESGLFGGADGRWGSGAVIFMARWFVTKAIEKYGLIERYDRFVVTRSDHYYGCEHDLSLLVPEFVWLPLGQDFGGMLEGITDRHMICNSRHILKALDIYPNVLRYPTKYVDSFWVQRNPEELIARRWQEENLWKEVRRFDRMMFTCAAAGDKTRWQGPSSDKVEEGVYLKYEEEYSHTKCTCNGRKWDEASRKCR